MSPIGRGATERRADRVSDRRDGAGNWLQVTVELCGGWSRQTSRRIRREVRAVLEWELPQYLRSSDRVWAATTGDVWVWLPTSTSGEAEALARRVRTALVESSLLAPDTRDAAVLSVRAVTFGPDASNRSRRRGPLTSVGERLGDLARTFRSV